MVGRMIKIGLSIPHRILTKSVYEAPLPSLAGVGRREKIIINRNLAVLRLQLVATDFRIEGFAL